MPVPPKGLIVDLVTPLHPDLSLDEASLGRLVERVIAQADAILAGSPDVGEALELPGATRRRLLAATVAAVAGRAPLFLGITGHSPEETRDLALAGVFKREAGGVSCRAFSRRPSHVAGSVATGRGEVREGGADFLEGGAIVGVHGVVVGE